MPTAEPRSQIQEAETDRTRIPAGVKEPRARPATQVLWVAAVGLSAVVGSCVLLGIQLPPTVGTILSLVVGALFFEIVKARRNKWIYLLAIVWLVLIFAVPALIRAMLSGP